MTNEKKTMRGVALWTRAFMAILPTKRQRAERLKELLTWDKNGTEAERAAKISALQKLINQ